jgi:outer membrane protein OmpA-like peptidoglycan-associated protein
MKSLLIVLSISVSNLLFSQKETWTNQFEFYFDSVSIPFQFDKSIYPTAQRSIISSPLWMLWHLRSKEVILKAYTDTTGSIEYNLHLAKERLETAKKLLPTDIIVVREIVMGEDLSTIPENKKRRVDVICIIPEPVVEEIATTPAPVKKVEHIIEMGVPVQLNIVFEGGKDVILPVSYEEVQFLIETMQKDSTLKVDLKGHVCCRNDVELSNKRANRIREILIGQGGIMPSRVTAKGYGNTQPLVPDTSEENMSRNRRVEATFSRN